MRIPSAPLLWNLALAASLAFTSGTVAAKNVAAETVKARAVQQAELEIDSTSSVFAVVTHKAGAAARLAHDHLIVAKGYSARLQYRPSNPLETSFELEAPVASLEIDQLEAQRAWFPRLQELGILDQAFGEMSAKNRSKVRAAMLGPKQLDGERFPTLSVHLKELRPAAEEDLAPSFTHLAIVSFEIHQQQVEASFPLRISEQETKIVFEAFGTLTLSDFGIQPYSALLGAVRNRDQVHVFLYLEATKISPLLIASRSFSPTFCCAVVSTRICSVLRDESGEKERLKGLSFGDLVGSEGSALRDSEPSAKTMRLQRP